MTRNIGLLAQISYILCQLLVCSGKSSVLVPNLNSKMAFEGDSKH